MTYAVPALAVYMAAILLPQYVREKNAQAAAISLGVLCLGLTLLVVQAV